MNGFVCRRFGIVVLLGFIATCVGCATGPDTEAPIFLDATVDTSLVVGVDVEKGPGYALGDPVAVAVDSARRLYVADNHIPAVQVYDDAGTHLRTIGRKGPGPGEFREIRDLHVRGDILTAIEGNEIERFRLDGRPLDTYSLEQSASWFALPLSTGQWVLASYAARGGSEWLLRIYSDDFQPTDAAFGRSAELVDSNTVSRVTMATNGGSLGPAGDGGVLFAPYLYEGQIAEYRPSRGEWRRSGTWTGYTERGAYEYEKVTSDAPVREAKIHTTYAGVFNAIYYNKSLGLFRRDGRVFHFTCIARTDHRLFGAEVYRSDGSMEGYVRLADIATDEGGVPTETTPVPHAMGPEGTFYTIEKGYGTVPKVVGLSVTVEGRGMSP